MDWSIVSAEISNNFHVLPAACAGSGRAFDGKNFFIFPLDNYIVMRYNAVTIYRKTIQSEAILLAENLALTEATYYILLSLHTPQHGYGIMQQTEALSHGRVKLAAGTLYGALNALCEKGWIEQLPVEPGSRRKEYQLTSEGRSILRAELARLKELVANGEQILKEDVL